MAEAESFGEKCWAREATDGGYEIGPRWWLDHYRFPLPSSNGPD